MIKTNINMSQDLLEVTEQEERKFVGKKGDNIYDERYFSKMDWRNTLSKMMSQVSKDALCMWETNKTEDWLDCLPKQVADDLVKIFSWCKLTDETIAKSAKDEKDAKDERKRREGEVIKKARAEAEEKRKCLTLPEGEEQWTAATCDEKFAELQTSGLRADAKKEVMYRQWRFIREWAELGKVKPGAGCTGGVGAVFEHLRSKLQDNVLMQKLDACMILYAVEASMAGGVLGEQLCKVPAVAPMELEYLLIKKRKYFESANENVRSKKHRVEEEEDHRLKSPRQFEWWWASKLYKKELGTAACKAKAGEKKAKAGGEKKDEGEQGGN